MAGERVLVIGGTGFIGRPLVRRLVETGAAVRVMARRPPPAPTEGSMESVEYVRGEVADPAALAHATDGISVVYDLSRGGGPTWDDHLRDLVRGAENVAEACLQRGVRRLVYTSTIAALQLDRRGRIDESAGADPRPHLRSSYVRAKIFAEEALRRLYATRRLPVVITRPGIVIGRGNRLSHPGLGDWVSPTCLRVVGRGRTPLPLVLVEDVAEALRLAKDAPGVEGRTFNLVGDVRFSAARYVEIAAARSLRNFHLQTRSIAGIQALRAAVWLGKALLGRADNPWLSYHELKSAPQRTFIDCAAAKEALGWRPVQSEEEFIRRGIDCHITLPRPGDLRVAS